MRRGSSPGNVKSLNDDTPAYNDVSHSQPCVNPFIGVGVWCALTHSPVLLLFWQVEPIKVKQKKSGFMSRMEAAASQSLSHHGENTQGSLDHRDSESSGNSVKDDSKLSKKEREARAEQERER